MIVERRLQAVSPYALALQTRLPLIPRGARGLRGMGLTLDDTTSTDDSSVWSDVLTLVNTGLKVFTTIEQGADLGTAFTNAQSLLSQLSSQYQTVKANGQLSSSTITTYQNAVKNLVSSFCNSASKVSGGNLVCQQLTMQGNNLINQWELDRATLPTFGIGNTAIIALVAIGALLFLRRG